MKLHRDQNGLTLVEVVIALTITAIVIGAVTNFAVDGLVSFTKTEARAELLDQAQNGLDVINSDIRLSASADSVNQVEDLNAPGSPGNNFSWQSDGTTLLLATAAEDSDGNILFSDPTEYISHKNNTIYYLSGSTLYRRVLAANVANNKAVTTCPPASATEACPSDRKIMENVQSYAITYRDGDNQSVAPENARSIEITVTLLQEKFGQDISVSYTTRTVFRND